MTDDIGEITKCYAVTFNRHSKHSAERLWRAITDPDEVTAWMGFPAKVDLRPGGDYVVDFGGDDGVLDGIIVRVQDGKQLGYVWGWSYVEWVITDDGPEGCSYTFVQNGLTDRGVDADEEGLAAGWHGFFDQLDWHLDGTPWTKEDGDRVWHEHKPAYRAQLDAVIR